MNLVSYSSNEESDTETSSAPNTRPLATKQSRSLSDIEDSDDEPLTVKRKRLAVLNRVRTGTEALLPPPKKSFTSSEVKNETALRPRELQGYETAGLSIFEETESSKLPKSAHVKGLNTDNDNNYTKEESEIVFKSDKNFKLETSNNTKDKNNDKLQEKLDELGIDKKLVKDINMNNQDLYSPERIVSPKEVKKMHAPRETQLSSLVKFAKDKDNAQALQEKFNKEVKSRKNIRKKYGW